MKEKYEPSSIHSALLSSIKQLSLDKRGAAPLKVWIDNHNDSVYQEARFKKGVARQIKADGKRVNLSVKQAEIPETCEVKVEANSDLWLEGIPKNVEMAPTFKKVVSVTSNSIRIDDKSLHCHLYTLEVYAKRKDTPDTATATGVKEEAIKDSAEKPTVNGVKREAMDADDERECEYGELIPLDDVRVPPEMRREMFYRSKRSMRKLYPTFYDQLHIFSFSPNAPSDPVLVINNRLFADFVIVLKRQNSTDSRLQCFDKAEQFASLYAKCQPFFQQQGLNIINRQRFFGANYTQLHKREDKYYSLRNLRSMEVWPQSGTSLEQPDLMLLSGYKSTVVYAKECMVKTQLANKLTTKHSVHELIEANGVAAVDKFIRGKRAVTSYSNQIVEMDGLDTSMSLDSTFDRNGQPMSYREYYTAHKKDSYGERIQLLADHEQALVIHHKFVGRGPDRHIQDTIHFIPQLLYVIVPVEQHNDATKGKLRLRSHPKVDKIVDESLALSKLLASVNKTSPFTTETQCMSTKAFEVEPPMICFQSRDGLKKVRATEFSGKEWRNVNAFWNSLTSLYSGQKESTARQIEWAICYDVNDRDAERNVAEIESLLSQFIRCRGFQRGAEPLAPPHRMGFDYGRLQSIRETMRKSCDERRLSVCLFILPSRTRYGNDDRLKTDITRHILLMQPPPASPSASPRSSRSESPNTKRERVTNNLSMDLQFINSSTVRKKNAVFNVFETLLLKGKKILYFVEPSLPSKVFNFHRLWMIGVKILRKKGGVHLVVISCNRAPFVGSIKYITNHSALIDSQKDVIPQGLMRRLCREMFKSALKKMAASRGEEQLPLNIAVLRSCGSDGSFKTMISKEVAGLKQALSDLSKERKLLSAASGAKHSKWYPGVIWSVFQDNVPDAFGVTGRDYRGEAKLMDSDKALLVADTITCANYFDVFLSLPTKQERQLYGRVVRLVTLMDDYNEKDVTSRPRLKLSKSAAHFSDYVNLVYASIWSYALNIPFPKVPNYPAPIKYAEHYASWQYGILTDEDMNLQSLAIDVDNAKPKIHIASASPSPPLGRDKAKVKVESGGGDVEMRMK